MSDFQEKIKQTKVQMSSLKRFLFALIFIVLISACANPLSSWFAESGF